MFKSVNVFQMVVLVLILVGVVMIFMRQNKTCVMKQNKVKEGFNGNFNFRRYPNTNLYANVLDTYMHKMDTREALLYCNQNKIIGSYVECGVGGGTHPIIACDTILKNNLDITDIYMFDTYEGLTKPGKYDYTTNNPVFHMNNQEVIEYWKQTQTGHNSSKWCYCSLEEVKKNVYRTNYPKNKLHFIKGDVMETLKEKQNIPDKISVLRLDTDWYESSKFELEILYNNVVDRGVVILDDYFHWDGQRRATDEFFQENNIKKTIYKNNTKTGFFIK